MKNSFIIAILLLFSMPIGVVFSQTTEAELRASISNLNAELRAVEKEIGEFTKKITSTQGEAKTLRQALEKLEVERAALVKQLEYTELQITKTKTSIVFTENSIASTSKRIATQQQGVAALFRTAYQEGNRIHTLSVFDPDTTFSGSVEGMLRAQEAKETMRIRVKQLAEFREELEGTKKEYEEVKAELSELQDKLSDQRQVVVATTKAKANLLVETKNKESEYQKLLVERQKKKQALEKEMLDFESKLKVVIDTSKLPKYGTGVLSWPLANVKISQYFGNTPFASSNPQVYSGSGHNGVDLATPSGTPLLSAQSGTVVATGDTDLACRGASYGRWVLIRHNNGLTTLYAHMSSIQVSAGQVVARGERIGLSGNTGYSTGPHLHFTVFASDAVRVLGPGEYRSRACGTEMVFPVAPRGGYLNPLSYL